MSKSLDARVRCWLLAVVFSLDIIRRGQPSTRPGTRGESDCPGWLACLTVCAHQIVLYYSRLFCPLTWPGSDQWEGCWCRVWPMRGPLCVVSCVSAVAGRSLAWAAWLGARSDQAGARTPTLPRHRQNKMKISNRGINLHFFYFCSESSLKKEKLSLSWMSCPAGHPGLGAADTPVDCRLH